MQTDLLPDFLHLYHCFGNRRAGLMSALHAFDQDPRRLRHSDNRSLRAAGLDSALIKRIRAGRPLQVERDLDWATVEHHYLISYRDSAYPELLRQIPDYPALLYLQGKPGLLARLQCAIVGSRLCTPGGAATAAEFAGDLARAGFVITSGLAQGIDSAAHRAALTAGGMTIAVVGTGIDRVYPRANHRLAAEICEQGLLVSEFPLGTPARREHFPRRNRIISGLALATLVVEAAQRSGSLITARLAGEQGREVFAIPGSIHNPQARGCHRLLRDGALLAESPQDITRELTPLIDFSLSTELKDRSKQQIELDDAHLQLLTAIGYDPVNCDILVQRSGLTIDKLSSMLLLLELNDLIQSAPGGCYVRI